MDRKEIIKALESHFNITAKYRGAPSFAYQLETAEGTYTVNKAGTITSSDGIEVTLEFLVYGLNEQVLDEASADPQVDPPVEPPIQQSTDAEPPLVPSDPISDVEVVVTMEGHTGSTLRNLANMVYSKQDLIRKSLSGKGVIIDEAFSSHINGVQMDTLESFKLAIDGLNEQFCPGITFDFDNSAIVFKFLEGAANLEKIQAYTNFVAMLNDCAKTLKYTSPKSKDTDNDKFSFRLFLVRIGMVGADYKNTRKVLLEKLDGNSAFRYGSNSVKENAGTPIQ